MSQLPAWLQAHLETIGAANPDGITRAARATHCRHCGARVIAGLDGDVAAMPTRVDDYEIDEIGEFLAVAQGIPTYTLRMTATASGQFAWNIDGRDISHMQGGRKHPTVAQHRCGIRLPPARKPLLAQTQTTPVTSAEPPF